jgi:hypothetical protein
VPEKWLAFSYRKQETYALLLTKSGKEAPNEARNSADPENMDAAYVGYEMPR